jgi:hypothetical protein
MGFALFIFSDLRGRALFYKPTEAQLQAEREITRNHTMTAKWRMRQRGTPLVTLL